MGRVHAQNRQAAEELVNKRGLIILGIVVLVGAWLIVIGYEFLEKENALFQKKVKAAKEEQQRCVARYAKYRNFDQFRTSIRFPYTSDLPPERWMRQFGTLRAGMSESEVAIIMGAPDYASCDLSKENDLFIGSAWHYQVSVQSDLNNEKDSSGIMVLFGPDGRLKDKFAMNMQPKPSPTPTATPVATATPESTATPVSSPAPSATPDASPQQAAPSATATPSPSPQ
jgi:outer membrane protein assembly factor BamE (lipoprotein component of BamABCDE complex)